MVVEERRYSSRESEGDGVDDRFPIGMRVLAVDDDPACLKLLDALLRRCQYNVTTTNQAVVALKMLRENTNYFDLVISDVQMPDIDGFKLLELVGLEMDLPVIMLSAYSETKYVMKGIAHGACDYLVKPVRIEELKNIWQHVIRKKKFDYKDQNKSPNQGSGGNTTGDGGQEPILTDYADQHGNYTGKRKEQDEGEEYEDGNDVFENEDSSTHKKARVVWSVDLHRKFVAVVNQLGIGKAFPKRILDLMNVEGITRENVASHLQKYRLYLKRISTAASQQANMAAALGSKDPSYMHLNALNDFMDFQTFSGPGRLHSALPSSYSDCGLLGRVKAPSSIYLRGRTLIPENSTGHAQNSSNSISNLGKFQPGLMPANHSEHIFPGIPTSFNHKQLQQSNQMGNYDENLAFFAVSGGISSNGARVNNVSNSIISVQNNPFLSQGKHREGPIFGDIASKSAFTADPLNQGTTSTCSNSSDFDQGRVERSWQTGVELSRLQSTASPSNDEPFHHDALPPNTPLGNIASPGLHTTNSIINFASPALEDSSTHCQDGLLGNVIQSINHEPVEKYCYSLDDPIGSLDLLSPVSGVLGSLSQSIDHSSSFSNKTRPANNMKTRADEGYQLEQTKSLNNLIQNGSESLEDLMAAFIKQGKNEYIPLDGEFGSNSYATLPPPP